MFTNTHLSFPSQPSASLKIRLLTTNENSSSRTSNPALGEYGLITKALQLGSRKCTSTITIASTTRRSSHTKLSNKKVCNRQVCKKMVYALPKNLTPRHKIDTRLCYITQKAHQNPFPHKIGVPRPPRQESSHISQSL